MKRVKLILFLLMSLFILGSCKKSSVDMSLIPVASDDKYGYIDKEGKYIINPQFDDANIFTDGRALVKKDGKLGYINKEGKLVIAPIYTDATIFSEGLAWVTEEDMYPVAIDKNGETKLLMKDVESVSVFKEDLASFTKYINGKLLIGFINKKGDVVIEPQFEDVIFFSEGLCPVKYPNGNKWGYINKKGFLEIDTNFDKAFIFYKNHAVVKLSNGYGIIDKKGKFVINPNYGNIFLDGDKFLCYNDEEKWGWLDKKGNIIIPFQFENALPFNRNKLAPISLNGDEWGYIDKKGKIMINPQFDMAYSFYKNLALIENSDKYGFINKKGQFEINPQFDDISYSYILFSVLDYYGIFNIKQFRNIGLYCKSDYFDPNRVVNAISFIKPFGLEYNINFRDIMRQFNLSPSDFDKFNSRKKVIDDKKVTTDVKYDFYVIGNPYDKSYDYYWDSYEYTFNPDKKVLALAYRFYLSGKAYDKEDKLIKAFKKYLEKKSDFWLNEDKSKFDMTVYSNGNIDIAIFDKYGTVVMIVLPAGKSYDYDNLF